MDHYQSQYASLRFERAGLFRAIRKRYGCTDVLYPGCSIHVTPSLFFPHIVYVDQSEISAHFFADEKPVLAYINRHKHYRQSAFFLFVHQDFLKPLPLREGTFDLLLALFAGGISQACKKYLRRGGLLVSNNHQNDAVAASRDEDFQLVAMINFRAGQYLIDESGMDATRISLHTSHKNSLRQTSDGVEYIERETYYVFQRQ